VSTIVLISSSSQCVEEVWLLLMSVVWTTPYHGSWWSLTCR